MPHWMNVPPVSTSGACLKKNGISPSHAYHKKRRGILKLVHPGERLREELDSQGLSASALAKALGVPASRITKILNGQRGLSADTALRLARYFGTTPESWLNLQIIWDLHRAKTETGKEIAKQVKPRHSAGTGGRSRRFNERYGQLIDLVDRFEAESSSTHARNALAAIGRLNDDGANFWNEGSGQLSRWRDYCTVLSTFLNRLGKRRHIEKQDLAKILREFIQEFEHSIGGMYEMLYGISDDPDDNPELEWMLRWFELVYRFSTYAIISFWIDDKKEHNSVKITMNLGSGECKEEWTREEMKVPKKYRGTTKKL